jgi:hypothetical protein
MSPEPDLHLIPIDSENSDYFSHNWHNLPWSPWVPFTATKEDFRIIPHEPGIYRIRPAGKDFLMYIGETRRTLHQMLNELRQSLKRKDLMPWNDPHTAAPALWAWQDAEGYEYECSATPLDGSFAVRKGMESFLLYRYRQEYGGSTLCNFGRFHTRYRKSANRIEGLRGGKLEDTHKDNPAGGLSIPPLKVTGTPGGPGWMDVAWSERKPLDTHTTGSLSPGPGLYFLFDAGSKEILSIGQSQNCSKRLQDHSRKTWEGKSLHFSVHIQEKPVLPHNLKEMENDLIGNYFEVYRKVPEYQFGNSR